MRFRQVLRKVLWCSQASLLSFFSRRFEGNITQEKVKEGPTDPRKTSEGRRMITIREF